MQTSLIKRYPIIQKEFSVFDDYLNKFIESKVPFIKENIEIMVNAKAKRFRPILVLLTAKMTKSKRGDDYAKMAVVIELLHTATLLHDDVIDEADMRRGVPTINERYDSKIAILVGDYLLGKCMELLYEIKDFDLLINLSQIVMRMCESEVGNLIDDSVEFSKEKYYQLIDGKTSSLLEICTKSVGILEKMGKEETQMLCDLGKYIGYLYQLKDDILDMKSETEVLGKTAHNDNGKTKTLPQYLGIDVAELEIKYYKEKCQEIVAYYDGNSGTKEMLDLIDFVINREY